IPDGEVVVAEARHELVGVHRLIAAGPGAALPRPIAGLAGRLIRLAGRALALAPGVPAAAAAAVVFAAIPLVEVDAPLALEVRELRALDAELVEDALHRVGAPRRHGDAREGRPL